MKKNNLGIQVKKKIFIRTSENSPLNSAPQSPKLPKSIRNLMEKPRLVVSIIPSLVLNKLKKLPVIPRVNRKYHDSCIYNEFIYKKLNEVSRPQSKKPTIF